MPALADYDGPLGALAPELARRRIAVAADGDGRPYLVRPDSVVVAADDEHPYEEVARLVRDHGLELLGGRPEPPPPGVLLGARRARDESPTRWSTEGAVRLIEELGGAGLAVSANHVYVADGVARHFWRVGDTGSTGTPGVFAPTRLESTARPAPPPTWLRPRLDLPGRERPSVLVLDTGLATRDGRAAHPELVDHCVIHRPWRDRRRVGRWDDEDEPDDDGKGQLDYQAGHGTFISGIVRQICPDAVVHHRGVLTSYGDGDDASVTSAVTRALQHGEYDVVVMSFGCYAAGDAPPPMARAIRRLLGRSVVVASAGNDNSSRPYFPAALPGVVAVGALDGDGRAPFSNFGPWVDACAPGVGVRSTFFTDFDDRAADGALRQSFRGWASWSGTSFAAPAAAALVAQEMYVGGGTSADAWERLRAAAVTRVPDLGITLTLG